MECREKPTITLNFFWKVDGVKNNEKQSITIKTDSKWHKRLNSALPENCAEYYGKMLLKDRAEFYDISNKKYDINHCEYILKWYKKKLKHTPIKWKMVKLLKQVFQLAYYLNIFLKAE